MSAIKKIDIKKFGLFRDYLWRKGVSANDSFMKLNVIYGRNYSGKTTLSRIFKCLEDGKIHPNYNDANFTVSLEDGTTCDTQSIGVFSQANKVRVYNKDFVRENLEWLHNDDGTIKPFTVLGAKNVENERRIKEIEEQIGKVQNNTGFANDLAARTAEHQKLSKQLYDQQQGLEQKLKDKASAIKNNTSQFDVPTYFITHLRTDIPAAKATAILKEEQIEERKNLLREGPKPRMLPMSETRPHFMEYLGKTVDLVSKPIRPSKPITELVEDALLQEWVRQGIDKHKGKRAACGFCGNALPVSLWEKLDAHFDTQSEELRKSLEEHLKLLEHAKKGIDGYLKLEKGNFYSTVWPRVEPLVEQWEKCAKNYAQNIAILKTATETRLADIFVAHDVVEIADNSEEIVAVLKQMNLLINENNAKATTLVKDQEKARKELRLSELAKFLIDIDFQKKTAAVDALAPKVAAAAKEVKLIEAKIAALLELKGQLEAQAKDESRGADLVNLRLRHFFGYDELTLEAYGDAPAIKFKISREGKDARNLSEGECSLISFCYFIAKIEDELNDPTSPGVTVYIDDPISSLDSNHVFFMFSLIESLIAQPKKYKQLFISTHNLDFLKYLRKLTVPTFKPQPGSKDKADINHFLIERRSRDNTQLRLCPDYLKKYITEFNYLFHEIYKCSTEDAASIGSTYQYSFGNNMRKFLEAYLFYKYPSHKLSLDKRLEQFFGNDMIAVNLVNRVINEYSHLGEHVDRGLEPLDVDAISRIAKTVIEKIQNTDPDQYAALLDSIGVN